jgi:predicted PurR-regulated permease PerM
VSVPPAGAQPLASALTVRSILRTVLVVVAVAVALYLIVLLRHPLTLIFIAGFLAIALAGPVAFLSRYMKRGVAIALVYASLVVAPFVLLGLLLPPIISQGNNLVQNAPRYAQDVSNFVTRNRTLRRLQTDYDITGKIEKEAAKLPSKIGDAAGVLSDIGLGIVSSIFTTVTIVVLSLFLMGAGPRWLERWAARHEPDRAEWWRRLFSRIGNAVGNYVAGALLQATVAGVTSWIVLAILGVPYALPLAVVVFVLDLVPLVGATLGAILVGIVTVFTDFPLDTIVWVVWAIVYQQIENTIIQPRIQARAVSLEPLIVLIAVLFGSTLFGVLGALLAIPVAAAIQITIREYELQSVPTTTGAVAASAVLGESGDPPGPAAS